MTTATEPQLIQDAPDGPGILTQADDGKLLAWDWGKRAFVAAALRMTGGQTVLRAGASRIQDAPDGPGSLGSGDDKQILVWNTNTGRFQSSGVLYVDYTNGRVGVNTPDPFSSFEVIAASEGEEADVTATGYGSAGGGVIHGRYARGTRDNPSAALAGDAIAGIGGRAYHSGGAFQVSSAAAIHWKAAENQTDAAYGMYMRFATTPKGSTTRQERVVITHDGTLWAHDTATFDPLVAAQTKPISDVLLLASGGSSVSAMIASYGSGSAGYRGGQASGTPASPSATAANRLLAFVGAHGHDGNAWTGGTKALITMYSGQTFTGSAQGTYITFETTANDSTSRAERMRIHHNGYVGVGTSAPVVPFQVAANAAFGDASAATYSDSGTTVYSIASVAGDVNVSGATNRAIPFYIKATFSGDSPARVFRGYGQVPLANTSALSGIIGMTFFTEILGPGGVTGNVGTYASALTINNSSATVANYVMYQASTPVVTAGTLTKQVGFQAGNLAQATNNTLLQLGSTTIPTGNFAIYNQSAYVNYHAGMSGFGVTAPTAMVHAAASTTARASFCAPHGTAPTAPVDGDIWTTTAGLFVRINGVTVGPLS